MLRGGGGALGPGGGGKFCRSFGKGLPGKVGAPDHQIDAKAGGQNKAYQHDGHAPCSRRQRDSALRPAFIPCGLGIPAPAARGKNDGGPANKNGDRRPPQNIGSR